jgi:tetratricopeptide (TPR) repeat protein
MIHCRPSVPLRPALPPTVRPASVTLGILISLALSPCLAAPSRGALLGLQETTPGPETARGREADLLPLPNPDREHLDPQLARQIESLEDLIRQRLPTAEPTELAGTFATLGHLFTYYELPAQALTCYENAHRLDPDNPDWTYYLAFLLDDLGEDGRATDLFEEVLKLDPDDPPTLLRLGNLYLDADRPDDAAKRFRQALEIDFGLAAGWYGLGRVAAREGDDPSAVQHFRKTLELQPEADLVYYSLAQALRRSGRLDEAQDALSHRGTRPVRFPDPRVKRLSEATALSSLELVRALAKDRQGMPDETFRTYALSQLSDVAGAVEHLDRTLAEWPEERREADRIQRGRLHDAVAALLAHQGRSEEARRHLRQALELVPDLTVAQIELADLLADERRFEEAAELLSSALERSPGDVAARLQRAAAYMALGRWQQAADDLFALERVDPTNFEVQGRLATVLAQLGKVPEAVERYRAAARLDPSLGRAARARTEAADLLLQTGAEEEAQTELERAVELDPALLDARLTLAGLLVRRGRLEDALKQFGGALEHHPKALEAHLGRATVLLLAGRYTAAWTALEESFRALPHPAVALLLARVLTAAPDDSVHDGARAEILARQLDENLPSSRTAELRALAAAETGHFDAAAQWQRTAVERARQAGQSRLADYLARRIPLYEAGRVWRAASPAELIVLPGES